MLTMGYAVGDFGTIIKTVNGGTNWTLQYTGTLNDRRLKSIYFADANTGYAVGENGAIIKTTDGGINWTMEPQVTNHWLDCVFFTNSGAGYAVGQGGTVLKIGGTSNSINENRLDNKIVVFPNPNNGIFLIDIPNRENIICTEIYNLTGTRILQQKTNLNINLSLFPKGIYFVKIVDGESVYNQKVIVQ